MVLCRVTEQVRKPEDTVLSVATGQFVPFQIMRTLEEETVCVEIAPS